MLFHKNRGPKAIDEELWNLDSYQTWTYTSLLIGQKAISNKWVFKVKYYPDNLIKKYKEYLVTQSFSHVHRIDYTKIFVPTIR